MSITAASAIFASVWITAAWVLLWIAVGLVSLGALLLGLPTHLRAAGGVEDSRLSGLVRARWAWGVVSVALSQGRGATLHLLGLRIWTFGPDKGERKAKREKETPRARGRLQWLLRHRQVGLRLLRRLLGTLRLQLRLQGELGLGDPADTALLHRLLLQLNGLSAALQVEVAPDWLDERVVLDGALRARIWPAHIGLVLLAALAKRETRQMIRTAPRAGR